MKRYFTIVFFFMFSAYTFAQKPHLYIGVKTLHGIQADLNLISNDSTIRFGLVSSYYIKLKDDFIVTAGGPFGFAQLFKSLNQNGFGIGAHCGIKFKPESKVWNHISIEYQNLKSGNYINDEGIFGGSTTTNYDEYYEKYHNFTLCYLGKMPIDRSSKFEILFESGIKFSKTEKQYTLTGTYSNRIPTDEKETFNTILPYLRAGINVRIF